MRLQSDSKAAVGTSAAKPVTPPFGAVAVVGFMVFVVCNVMTHTPLGRPAAHI
jgi:hypothetical protein